MLAAEKTQVSQGLVSQHRSAAGENLQSEAQFVQVLRSDNQSAGMDSSSVAFGRPSVPEHPTFTFEESITEQLAQPSSLSDHRQSQNATQAKANSLHLSRKSSVEVTQVLRSDSQSAGMNSSSVAFGRPSIPEHPAVTFEESITETTASCSLNEFSSAKP